MAAAAPFISDDVADDESRRRLAVGAVCSVVLHAAAAGVLFFQPGGFGGSLPSPLEVALPAAELPPEIQPGIEQSRQVTINWLGFEDPTPHSATVAEIDQAALSPIASGVPEAAEVPELTDPTEPALEVAEALPEPIEPAEEADESEPVEVAEASDEAEPIEAAVIVEAAAEPETEVAAEAPEETLAELEAGDAGDAAETEASPVLAVRSESTEQAASRLFRSLSRAAARARRAVVDAQIAQAAQIAQELQDLQQAMAAQSAQSAADAASPAAPPPPGDPRDAIASEKESDATSRTKIAEWEPGKPPAVEGLDITTVRPRWTVTTRMMSVPRNPVVRIEFRKNGTVARAAFLDRQDTGYSDVDGPLLDAIYAWTAKGRALDALAADDPKAVAPITMRIILIPGSGTIRNPGSSR
ncbi:MAG: hypothetical protein ACF8R9_01645 [Phycisphaerales bacterium JB054]